MKKILSNKGVVKRGPCTSRAKRYIVHVPRTDQNRPGYIHLAIASYSYRYVPLNWPRYVHVPNTLNRPELWLYLVK